MKIITVIIVLLLALHFFSCENREFSKEINKTVNVEIGKSMLKFKVRVWGITGNHYDIKLFDTTGTGTDTLQLFTPTLFYKVINNDSITIFTGSFKGDPTNISNDIKVGIVKRFNFRDYLLNYKEYGLEIVSTSDD